MIPAGDIMGGCETSVSVIGSFAPMERVVLSANGNLQRIMRYCCNVLLKFESRFHEKLRKILTK